MKYQFTLPMFPNSKFELQHNAITGKNQLYKDNVPVGISSEKGNPFLIPSENDIIKAYFKYSLPDYYPVLEINGEKYYITEKLKWSQYALCALPMLLFLGGLLGGGIGAFGTIININIFLDSETNFRSKYFKIIGVTIACITVYAIGAYYFL